jgi:sugar phosphate isomerase/epimerase
MSAVTRRGFLSAAAAMTLTAASHGRDGGPAVPSPFKLRYLLGSCLYGYMDMGTILPHVAGTGAEALDIWPKVHGSQREQLDDMGEERFAALLARHNVRLGCITQYRLGPFNLLDELRLAARLGCRTVVTGGKGPKGLAGGELKAAVRAFVAQMAPTLETADETGVTVAIENHGNNLIDSPDALKWLMEFRPSKHLGVALAPYHLPQDAGLLASLIRALGNECLAVFYAWQHGEGCMTRMPKEKELLQMPGRGPLDFKPLVAALREIGFSGWTEIFMHATPRGVPILETDKAVADEINRARAYLDCDER